MISQGSKGLKKYSYDVVIHFGNIRNDSDHLSVKIGRIE